MKLTASYSIAIVSSLAHVVCRYYSLLVTYSPIKLSVLLLQRSKQDSSEHMLRQILARWLTSVSSLLLSSCLLKHLRGERNLSFGPLQLFFLTAVFHWALRDRHYVCCWFNYRAHDRRGEAARWTQPGHQNKPPSAGSCLEGNPGLKKNAAKSREIS